MKYLFFIIIYLLGEVVAHFVFRFVRKRFQEVEAITTSPKEQKRNRHNAIGKGMLERFFIYISLANGLPHVLTVLGALKIGTRLDAEKQHAISNDYFLIGNILSIMLAILYYFGYEKLRLYVGY